MVKYTAHVTLAVSVALTVLTGTLRVTTGNGWWLTGVLAGMIGIIVSYEYVVTYDMLSK